MQAICLNLLAEQQLEREVEARDPFKPCLAVVICSFSVLIVTGLWVQRLTQQAATQKAELEQRIEALQAAARSGPGNDLKTLRSTATEYLTLNQGRPLFAAMLARLKDVVPDPIELRQLNLALVMQAVEPVAPPADTSAENKPARKAPRPKPVELLVITLDGRAVSPRPEMEVDQFIRVIKNDPQLQPTLKEVRLRSIAREDSERPGAARTGPAATFVVECTLQEGK